MSEWQKYTIGQLIDSGAILIHKDGNHGANYPRASDFGKAGLPFLTAKSLSDWTVDIANAPRLSRAKADTFKFGFVAKGDVLLSHNATVGRVAIVPDTSESAVIGTSLTQYRLDQEKIEPRFLALYFASRDFQNELSFTMSQTTRNQVPITAQRRLPVHIPPLPIQHQIVEVIFSLIEKIDLNRQTNQTLDAMARTIFGDWFVDFGPVRAKAMKMQPYLANDIWELFPNALDEEEKPVTWRTGTVAEVAELNPESWGRRSYPQEIEYVDLANTKWGTIEATERLSRDSAPSRAQRILRAGDTIVGTVRPGNGSYAYVGNNGLTGSTGFAVLRPKREEARELVYCAATSAENIDRLAHLADGGAYPAVRPEAVLETKFVGPRDHQLASSFSKITSPIMGRIEANKRENRALAQTRDLLLPKLMSGEIRLKEAEKVVEAAI